MWAAKDAFTARYGCTSRKQAFVAVLPWRVGTDIPLWLDCRAFDLFVDTRRSSHAAFCWRATADRAANGASVACPAPGSSTVSRQTALSQWTLEWRGMLVADKYALVTRLLTAAPPAGAEARVPLFTRQCEFW